MTKKQLEIENAGLRGEIKHLVALAHKALGAREPNHDVSAKGLAREYLEQIIAGKG
jgi:hypothetical protein